MGQGKGIVSSAVSLEPRELFLSHILTSMHIISQQAAGWRHRRAPPAPPHGQLANHGHHSVVLHHIFDTRLLSTQF